MGGKKNSPMFATLCAIVLGIIAGTITGITPGIHLNLVAALTLANAPLVLQYTTIENIVGFLAGKPVNVVKLEKP